jgi:hypothetical protein
MSPEQQREMRVRMLSERLKQQGFTDEEIKAVVDFQTAKGQAEMQLGQEFQKFVQVVRAQDSTDEQIQGAVTQYHSAMKVCKDSEAAALKKLDEAVRYSARPKIEGTLLAMGILDNGLPTGGMFRRQPGMGGGPRRGQQPGQGQAPGGQTPPPPPQAGN